MTLGKTIQIYLPDGNPRSVKIVEITTSIAKGIFIPRSKLNNIEDRKELDSVGIYFLFGENDDLGKPTVYIGEAENLIKRLKQHNSSKDFWNTAIAFFSEKNNLNKAHVKYLENYCCMMANRVNRCNLENSVNPTKSNITEADENFVLSLFEDINVLLGTLGYPIFEGVIKEANNKQYICQRRNANAKGEYNEDGFVIFKGSKANLEATSSCPEGIKRFRQSLIDKKVLSKEGGSYIFNEDFMFNSPSTAAAVVIGASSNGWIEWKNSEGKTLGDIERKG